MHLRYSLLPRAFLLALVVAASSLAGSSAWIAGPASSAPQASAPAAPHIEASSSAHNSETILIGLHPELAVDDSVSDGLSGNTVQRRLAPLGVLAAEALFAQPAPSPGGADLRAIYRLRLAPNADRAQTLQALRADPTIAYAEPDYQASLIAEPSDSLYPSQWGLAKIGSPTAWDVTTGSGDVVIAVIDSGADIAHTDLAGQLWTNPGEIPGNGIDDDNNGRIDDIHGWNFISNNADLSDTTGHGTQVAGVIAAAANNNNGGAGICWGCKLMIVKVVQPGAIANYSDIAAGVLYAARKGAKVINLSLGGSSDSATLSAAIHAAAQTAVLVGGAGNNNSSAPFYPAAYQDAVLAVAGATQADTKIANSNYGPWVDVVAPGTDIVTTFSGGGYGSASGTSLAAPFGSGLAGLLLSAHPEWTPSQVQAQIANTSTPIDGLNPGLAGQLGSGRINAGQALTTLARPALGIASYTVNGELAGRPEPGATVELFVTLANQWNTATNVQATLSGSGVIIDQPSASFGTIAALKSGANTLALHFTAVSGYNAPMSLTLRVTADGGYAMNLPLSISTSPGVVAVPATIATTTWTADHTYLINQDSGVPVGATLTINPGTVIRLAPNTSFTIAGTLIANGTSAQPIRFTHQGAGTPWGQLKFANTSGPASFDGAGNYAGGSILRGAIVEYSQGIYLDTASPYIANNTFSNLPSNTMMPGVSASAIGGSPGPKLVIADNIFSNAGLNLTGSYRNGQLLVLDNTLNGGTLQTNGSGDNTTIISGNTITNSIAQNIALVGITASGAYTVTANRVTGGSIGISVSNNAMINAHGGLISGNLVSNTSDYGVFLSPIGWGVPVTTTLKENTIIVEHGVGVGVNSYSGPGYTASGVDLYGNNLITTPGVYALRLANSYSQNVDATGNWWGTSDDAVIQGKIYDGNDKFQIGFVDYSGLLPAPNQSAPAFVQRVTVNPDSTLGIQQGAFTVEFSRPMDQSTNPLTTFHDARRGTWSQRDLPVIDSGVFGGLNNITDLVTDVDGSIWASTYYGLARYDGSSWTTYSTLGGNQPIGGIQKLAIDQRGTKWAGTAMGLARFDGVNWFKYPCSGSNVPCLPVTALAIDRDGSPWIATGPGGGVAHLTSTGWVIYTESSTGVRLAEAQSIAVDRAGTKWFILAGNGHLVSFNGTTWTRYTAANTGLSGLPEPIFQTMAVDRDGSVWFGTQNSGLVRFDGSFWQSFTQMSLMSVWGLAIDAADTKWFVSGGSALGSFDGSQWTFFDKPLDAALGNKILVDSDGDKWSILWPTSPSSPRLSLGVLRGGQDYSITENAQWLDDHTWRATYDITSLITRGAQTISIGGARGLDGMEIAADNRFRFTVDYAGTITDRLPPDPPRIFTTGVAGNPSAVRISWPAGTVGISAYRYTIGSAPGATDIVDWTTVSPSGLTQALSLNSSGGSGVIRTGLGLVNDKQYWVRVEARNSGGLWSTGRDSSFISGQQSWINVYLPLTEY